MKHPSPRLVLAAMSLAVLGGTAASASAAEEEPAKKRMICLINQDDAPTSAQHGLCVNLPPTLPKLP